MGKEALLHQPDTAVLCVLRETRGHTLVLLGGVLECKDEGAPSALDAAIVCGIDHTPFDAIAFFLQALQDDAKITAPLRCGRFQQTIHILQQNIAWVILLDDFINRPPENALLAFDAFGTGAGNRVVLTGKATHQKVVRRHLVYHGGDICIHTVGILAKIFVVALISPLTSLAGFPLVCPNRLKSFGTTL